MAFTPATLSLLPSLIASKQNVWMYTTTDAITSVDDTDYFASGEGRGMKDNDIVFVNKTDDGSLYLAKVSAVDADGNATVTVTTTVSEQAAIADFTDSTGGAAADGTLVEVTDLSTSNTYTDAALNAKFDIVNNNFKDVAAKVNALLAALRSAGVLAT